MIPTTKNHPSAKKCKKQEQKYNSNIFRSKTSIVGIRHHDPKPPPNDSSCHGQHFDTKNAVCISSKPPTLRCFSPLCPSFSFNFIVKNGPFCNFILFIQRKQIGKLIEGTKLEEQQKAYCHCIYGKTMSISKPRIWLTIYFL